MSTMCELNLSFHCAVGCCALFNLSLLRVRGFQTNDGQCDQNGKAMTTTEEHEGPEVIACGLQSDPLLWWGGHAFLDSAPGLRKPCASQPSRPKPQGAESGNFAAGATALLSAPKDLFPSEDLTH